MLFEGGFIFNFKKWRLLRFQTKLFIMINMLFQSYAYYRENRRVVIDIGDDHSNRRVVT